MVDSFLSVLNDAIPCQKSTGIQWFSISISLNYVANSPNNDI